MTKRITTASIVVLMAGFWLVADTHPGRTQAAGTPSALSIGIYTPTVEFKDAASRLQYVQRLAKAIEAATGASVNGKSYSSLGALKKAKPDFAIIDAQCYASNSKWELLANGEVDGKGSRSWALFSRVGGGMPGLKGQKLAYVQMGCRDNDFIFNAMLESEVPQGHFSGRVGKQSLQGAVAQVASFKGAAAVFAPTDSGKGLTKVFDTGAVPGPAFVQMNGKLNSTVVAKVKKAVVGYGGGGAISGWGGANKKPYSSLQSRMGKRVKRPVFATPLVVRLGATNVIKTPGTLSETALTDVKQHFEEPPARQ